MGSGRGTRVLPRARAARGRGTRPAARRQCSERVPGTRTSTGKLAMRPQFALVCEVTFLLLLSPLIIAAPVPATIGPRLQRDLQVADGEDNLGNLPRAAMRDYLVELSDWIMTLDLGSNHLKGNYTPASAPTHIFIVSGTNDARECGSPA